MTTIYKSDAYRQAIDSAGYPNPGTRFVDPDTGNEWEYLGSGKFRQVATNGAAHVNSVYGSSTKAVWRHIFPITDTVDRLTVPESFNCREVMMVARATSSTALTPDQGMMFCVNQDSGWLTTFLNGGVIPDSGGVLDWPVMSAWPNEFVRKQLYEPITAIDLIATKASGGTAAALSVFISLFGDAT